METRRLYPLIWFSSPDSPLARCSLSSWKHLSANVISTICPRASAKECFLSSQSGICAITFARLMKVENRYSISYYDSAVALYSRRRGKAICRFAWDTFERRWEIFYVKKEKGKKRNGKSERILEHHRIYLPFTPNTRDKMSFSIDVPDCATSRSSEASVDCLPKRFSIRARGLNQESPSAQLFHSNCPLATDLRRIASCLACAPIRPRLAVKRIPWVRPCKLEKSLGWFHRRRDLVIAHAALAAPLIHLTAFSFTVLWKFFFWRRDIEEGAPIRRTSTKNFLIYDPILRSAECVQ